MGATVISRSLIMQITDKWFPDTITDERIKELESFQTKDYTDCPVQTAEQLLEFKPKYQNRIAIIDADIMDWLRSCGTDYQSIANTILRKVMQSAAVHPARAF
jgi:uncharacterized protein (DUF4415 family)